MSWLQRDTRSGRCCASWFNVRAAANRITGFADVNPICKICCGFQLHPCVPRVGLVVGSGSGTSTCNCSNVYFLESAIVCLLLLVSSDGPITSTILIFTSIMKVDKESSSYVHSSCEVRPKEVVDLRVVLALRDDQLHEGARRLVRNHFRFLFALQTAVDVRNQRLLNPGIPIRHG